MRFSVKGLWKSQRGFTLLEMLIVISIVGVLAVVAVPRFTNAIALANTARIQSDLQVLNAAIVMYQTDPRKESAGSRTEAPLRSRRRLTAWFRM